MFGYGFVTYSNKAKHKCLGVKKSTLKEKGAVSAKCAREMAKGACKESGADISISVTGLQDQEAEQKKLRLELYLWVAATKAGPLQKSSTSQETVCGSVSRPLHMHWLCYVTVSLWVFRINKIGMNICAVFMLVEVFVFVYVDAAFIFIMILS